MTTNYNKEDMLDSLIGDMEDMLVKNSKNAVHINSLYLINTDVSVLEVKDLFVDMLKQLTDQAGNIMGNIKQFRLTHKEFAVSVNDAVKGCNNQQLNEYADKIVQMLKRDADRIHANCVFILSVLSKLNIGFAAKDALYFEGKIANMCRLRAADIKETGSLLVKFKCKADSVGGDAHAAAMLIGKESALISDAADALINMSAANGFSKFHNILDSKIENGSLLPFSYDEVAPTFTKEQEMAMVRQFIMENAIADMLNMTVQEVNEEAKIIVSIN
jgi:hypothetical protein